MDEEWSQHVAEAMYVESFRAKLVGIELAQIMAKLFAPTKTNKGKKKP